MIKGCEIGTKKKLDKIKVEKLVKYILCMNYDEKQVALYTVARIEPELVEVIKECIDNSKSDHTSPIETITEYLKMHHATYV